MNYFRRGENRLLSGDIHRQKVVKSPGLAAAAAAVTATAVIPMKCSERSMKAPVCALVDAMFRLPAKLDRLLFSHCHMLPRGAEAEIPLLKQDLEKMVAILQEHDNSGAEDCAMVVKCLIKEVRELSYDMEDSIDQYEHAANSRRGIPPRRNKYKITRRRGKTTARLPEKLKWRLWMANKIREFSVRSQEALQRYSLLNHLGGNGISKAAAASTRSDASFGSWHPTPYRELVGIDAPMKKLEAWLGKDGEQKLKVVSVVGSGGVGKTTLANELYRKIGGQFECRAFVRMSRKPDVRRLLISMLSQVQPHQPPHTWKVHSLIANIRTHLQDKRYLIIIDDLWSASTWDIINHALPDGNLCSGILITTEIEDAAVKCCGYDSKYVFTLKPLGDDDSSTLFFNTAFGPQHECPPELSEVSNNIIRKCGGLPLAVTVASLLVSWIGKPEQWWYANKSLGYGLRTNPTSEGMKQVLNLSFNNLPQHLKACLMYLSIYQENYIIQKDDLVKQWMAEGLICATEEKDMEELSRSYFDELISSRMVQPVHVNDNDDVVSCMVHHTIHDFVTRKSLEENFVTAIDHCQTTVTLADKVRRLSLHFCNAVAIPPSKNMRLSQVRTLAFFGIFKCLPSIVEFGLLQVLILHLWGDDASISFDLTKISELFRLRYLHVTCNVTLEVPETKMRGLRYLETLKIDARVSALPSDIVHLPGLLHLSLPVEIHLPDGIGQMTSLCTLAYFDLSVNSIENVQSLSELTNLQDLRLTSSRVPPWCLKSRMDSMGSILEKLSKLRSLTLEPSSILNVGLSSMSVCCDELSSLSSPPALLQRFEWSPHICTFSSLPKWIGNLDKLCILKIGVTQLARNDVDVLRGLPALTVLSLFVQAKPAERIFFSNIGFSVLKYFKFKCSVPWLEFEVDAMPNLRKLKIGFDARGADQHGTVPVGIEHLSGLKDISAKIWGAIADEPHRRAAELALSSAFKMHQARPTFNIQCVDGTFNGKDDNNSGLQEEGQRTLQKHYEIMEEDSIEQHGAFQKGSRKDACGRYQTIFLTRFSAFSEWKTVADKQPDNRTHTQSRIEGMMTGLSSSSRWTKWLKTEAQKEEHRNLQKQYMIMKDSGERHEVLHKYSEKLKKHADNRKKLPKWKTQVKGTSQDAEGGDDGFSWRKYGQKDILGAKYPRGYYRCTHRHLRGCRALKQLQRTDGDPLLFDVMYVGHHTCNEGVNMQLQLGQHDQSSASVVVNAEESVQGLKKKQSRMPKRSTQVRLISPEDGAPLEDGFTWRKYGQKDVLGSKYPRGYYRCLYRQQGCTATKQVQRTDSDPQLFDVVYHGEHICAQSATSESQVTCEEVRGSIAGFRSMTPGASNSEVTEAGSGSGSTVGFPIMSPAMSECSTYEVVSASPAGFWSTPDEVESMMDDTLDPDLDIFDDFQLVPFPPDQ